MALAPQGKQPVDKGKGKAGKGGAAGGSSTKAAAAAGSSGQGSSSQGSSRASAPPARIIGFRTEADAVQTTPPLAAEAVSGAQQTEPEPAGGGSTKKDKERQRKERQRRRNIDVAWEALQCAVEAMAEHGARCVHSHEMPSKEMFGFGKPRKADQAEVIVIEVPAAWASTHVRRADGVLSGGVGGGGLAGPARARCVRWRRQWRRRRSTRLAART
jgi:hypothetical protein